MRRIVVALGVMLVIAAATLCWLHYHTSRFDFIIGQASARHEVDFHLVKSLIYEESWFRPGVRGPVGEIGLMQITRAAAADFAAKTGFPVKHEEQLAEPEINIEIGCWYLKRSLEMYKDSPKPTLFALLRYNAGETRADNWLRMAMASEPHAGIPSESHCLSVVNFPKTRAYVQRILERSRSRRYWF